MIPFYSDPEVLEQVYRRFPYLNGAPLTFPEFDHAWCLKWLEVGHHLVLLLADPVTEIPYPADHRGLSNEENEALTQQLDVMPVIVWPQPVIGVNWNAQHAQGVTSDLQAVTVSLKNAGSVQLWWGSGLGAIFEAFITKTVRQGRDRDVMHALWEACEQHLHQQGVTRIVTEPSDPEFEALWYRRFLIERKYRARAEYLWEKRLPT